MTVMFDDGSTDDAKVVGISETNDLAVIKVDGEGQSHPGQLREVRRR